MMEWQKRFYLFSFVGLMCVAVAAGINAGEPDQRQNYPHLRAALLRFPLLDKRREYYESRASVDRILKLLGDSKTMVLGQFLLAQGESPRVRSAAAYLLGRDASAQATPYLLKALKDRSYSLPAEAAKALGKIDDPAILPQVVELSRSGNPRYRKAAYMTIDNLCVSKNESRLISLLGDRDDAIRLRVARCLGKIRSDRVRDALIGVLDDSNNSVVLEAAKSLAKIGDMKSAKAIESRIEKVSDPALRSGLRSSLVTAKNRLGRYAVHKTITPGVIPSDYNLPESLLDLDDINKDTVRDLREQFRSGDAVTKRGVVRNLLQLEELSQQEEVDIPGLVETLKELREKYPSLK